MESSRSNAMPLCSSCFRRPSQIVDICWAAKQDGKTPEDFVLFYWKEFSLDGKNRFLCTDCKAKFAGEV